MLLKYDDDDSEVKIRKKSYGLCIVSSLFGILIGTLIALFYPTIIDTFCNFANCQDNKCQVGYWGKECYPCLECGANGICNGTGTKEGNGLCVCNIGWDGKYCQKCDKNFYGKKCSNCTACGNGYCNDTFYGNGKCICYEPFSGENCNNCINNKFGKKCNNNCTCINGVCNKENGLCKKNSCDINWSGDKCNECSLGYHKINEKCIEVNNLSQICADPRRGYSIIKNKFGLCKECMKDSFGIVCSGHGQCDGIGTTRGHGTCKCNTNYTGSICQYNNFVKVNINNCINSCSNNGNCYQSLGNNSILSCNCKNEYAGSWCQYCATGYYRNLTTSSCKHCKVNHNMKNYWGEYCDKCDCINGQCDNGYNGTGQCSCNEGFYGTKCNKCLSGYYGKECTKCNNCNHGICNDTILGNGKCICKIGYKGEKCNKCNFGFVSINSYCQECPGSYGGRFKECSSHGKCTNVNNNANCKCDDGWKGYSCSEQKLLINKAIKETNNCTIFNDCGSNEDKGICVNNMCYCYNSYSGDMCNVSIIKKCQNDTNCDNCHFCDRNKICSLKQSCSNNFAAILPKKDITKQKSVNTGEAVGISIGTIFVFIGLILSVGLFIKNRKKMKRYATSMTASNIQKIELTKEEKEVINPLMNIKIDKKDNLLEAGKILEDAVRKDHEHEFEEAIVLYNKAIDMIMYIMKMETNAGARFSLAKRVDCYLQRANYLKKIIDNRNLLNE